MKSPPKRKRGCNTALKTAKLRAAYHTTCLIAKALAALFWFCEQRRARLQDRLANEGTTL